MKFNLICTLFFISTSWLTAQNANNILEGKVTFKSLKNIYVRFISTADIESGDTLYVHFLGKSTPALQVQQKSST